MKQNLLLAATALTFAAGTASAEVIFEDDFESYTSTADMGTVWNLSTATLNTSFGNPGQSMAHPGTAGSFTGGNTNTRAFTEIAPTVADPLSFTVDIYDDATSANKRTTAGIREASGANIIEMGMYNGPSHYAYRVILFGPGDPSWVAFSNVVDDNGAPITNAPVEGWHTFNATVTPDAIAFTLDLNGDGFINATALVPIAPVDLGFDVIRLGGPSDLSSAGGGVSFDNVSLVSGIATIPEPATAGLMIGGLGLLAARRRRA